MKFKTLRDLRKACVAHGATLELDSEGRHIVYQCVAPKNMLWEEGCHCLCVMWGNPSSRADKSEIIEDTMNRMSYGIRPATEQELFEMAED